MKKFNNKKSVLERGGLMIEALAMLGLIAVVTPTMYKKSAERTMEVEDINTASAIRTYMNGVESLLSANYTELMEKIPEPEGSEPTMVPLSDIQLTIPGDKVDEEGNPISDTVEAQEELEKYLPYGYSAKDNLFNYGQPEFYVARAGNNLSAYMVFPSKASDDDDGIGQERTVRIASLIGSNGGYIRDDDANEARGVGGTWKLKGENSIVDKDGNTTTVKDVVLKNAGKYSIVTSSVDIVNGAEGMGGDMTKYLQRTAENGEVEKWRNTMRTDIYMGELNNPGHDYDDKTTNGYFSIRNINQLIVGADGAAADEEHGREGDLDRDNLYVNKRYQAGGETGELGETGTEGADEPRGLDSYGLYIADETDDTKGKYGVNAYIAGSLEAAGRRLFTDENELTYHGPKVQLGGMDPDEETGFATKYLITAVTENIEEDEDDEENLEPNPTPKAINKVEIMPVSKEGSDEANPLIIASDSDLNDQVNIGNISEEKSAGTKLLLAKAGDKTLDGSGAETEDGYNDSAESDVNVPKINYDDEQPVPQFPVVVDSNMAVNGVLTAGQLDTQKIRAAELSVGSENINDKLKWMDVDKEGVHIHSITEGSAAATKDAEGKKIPAKAKMQLEVNDNIIAMRAGSAAQALNDADNAPTTHESQFIMDDSGVKIIAQGRNGENNVAAAGHSIELTTGGNGVRERLENNEITIGSPATTAEENEEGGNNQYRVKYENGGHVDMVGTTLQVTDKDANPVFTIRGNDDAEAGLAGGNYNDPSAYKTSENDTSNKFRIAGHGNTVFTSEAVSHDAENNAIKFLAMGIRPEGDDNGVDDQYNAGVNIVSDNETGSNNKRLVYIDLENASSNAYVGAPTGWDTTSGTTATKLDTFSVANRSEGGKRTMAQGTVYIRKGLIDISPVRNDFNGNGQMGNASADTSSGTVRASRFVANNVDMQGRRVQYVNKVDTANKYQPGVKAKYDTYMVNPAYTSVMKDIKLTSRLGARLSDILPDFITKRIYLSNNSYGEDLSLGGNTGADALANLTSANLNQLSGGSSDYASPFLGAIPRPACPPGYGRAITVIPIGFEMGTVGSLEKIERGGSASLDVSPNSMLGVDANGNSSYQDQMDLLTSQPAFGRIRNLAQGQTEDTISTASEVVPAQLSMTEGSATREGGKTYHWDPEKADKFYQDTKEPNENNGDLENRIQLTGGVNHTAIKNGKLTSEDAAFDKRSIADLREETFYIEHFGYSVNGGKNADKDKVAAHPELALKAEAVAYNYDDNTGQLSNNVNVPGSKDGAYFLVSNDPKRPITFQKSTWLKTAATDIEEDGFASGWKVYMGFIYPFTLYKDFPALLGVNPELAQAKKQDFAYWNLFPVLKGTLTAYSTTYCFIDNRTDALDGSVVRWDATDPEDGKGYLNKAGNFQYDINEWNTSFAPSNADERNEFLNDPALKYDEVW